MDAIVLLSAVAAHTRRVTLGTICLASFPFRHPIQLAIQWASLDLLSKGRTILSVCIGGSPEDGPQFAHELEVMGLESNQRVGRLVEGVKVLRRLWAEEQVTHTGRYYRFTDVNLLPKPVQRPVPIWIAANPKEGKVDDAIIARIMRRVATHADGWQTDATPVETFRQRFEMIKEYAAGQGRDPSRLDSCLHLMVNINEDREVAFVEAEAFMKSYYGTGFVSRDLIELWLAYGSPAAVIEKIQAYIDAGCTTPVLRFVSPDLQGQLQRCIEEVLPAFKA